MSVCSLYEILQRCIEGLKSAAAVKNINIQLFEGPLGSEVWGDSHRLQQVADNILSNAIKFTQIGGMIEVRCEDKGDGLQVSVLDNGPGIGPEEAKKIFDMFYQVDASSRRPSGGAGLGLAIANGIVSMHGGRLWVESERYKGADFRFIIPRYKARQAA